MTRLLQAMAGARHGGAEAFFTRLAIALEADGQPQKVAIRRDPARAAALRAGGVDVIELGFGGRFDVLTRPRLASLAASWKPDLVLTWMNRATVMFPRGNYVHAARLGGYYDLKYYRACDHLIGNTRDIVAYLVRNGWPETRAHYLPNFVDDTAVAPIPRGAFATPADAKLLVALGRLHRTKGFDVLLHAMAKRPDTYLWLAGEGEERAALEHLADQLGLAARTRFFGWRDDASALIRAADLVVVPSRAEPLGNVVIEAWAHRVPVVAAASPGPAALITEGVTGFLAAVDDAADLAAAIDGALHADRAALVQAGRDAYERDFTEAAVVEAYRALFARIAG